jgi:hypothetical protein
MVHSLHIARDSYFEALKWMLLCDFAFFAALREIVHGSWRAACSL